MDLLSGAEACGLIISEYDDSKRKRRYLCKCITPKPLANRLATSLQSFDDLLRPDPRIAATLGWNWQTPLA